jgi:LysM repeat protein
MNSLRKLFRFPHRSLRLFHASLHAGCILLAALTALAPMSTEAHPARVAGSPEQAQGRSQPFGGPRPYISRAWPDAPATAPASTPDAPALASDTAVTYTVKAGDTLFGIGASYGVSPDVITAANPFLKTDGLQPGARLLIPWSNPIGTARYGAKGPVVTGKGLHFVVSISMQACWLFRDGVVQERWPCSTGLPESPTIPGNYTVQTKMARGWGGHWEFWMPYWLGLYDAGGVEDGIHGLPYSAKTGEKAWVNQVGQQITYGCILLDDEHASKLYDLAYVGMPVTVLR